MEKEFGSLLEKLDKEVFTDDIKLEMMTIFENEVSKGIKEKEKQLKEEYEKKYSLLKSKLKEQYNIKEKILIEKIDEYLDSFVRDFLKENQKFVVDSYIVEQAKYVMRNFKNLMEKFEISVSDKAFKINEDIKRKQEKIRELEKIELLKEQKIQKKLEELKLKEEKLLEDMERKKMKYERLVEQEKENFYNWKKANILNEELEKSGLNKYDKEKVIELSENLKYIDSNSFRRSVRNLIDGIETTNKKRELKENVQPKAENEIDDDFMKSMEKYI